MTDPVFTDIVFSQPAERNLRLDLRVPRVAQKPPLCDECGVPHDLAYFALPQVKTRFAGVADNLRRYLGGPLEERLELAQLVSPWTYISPRNPPMLLIHGEEDTVVPAEEMIAFHAALRRAGVDVTLRILPGIGHGWDANLTRDDVVSFFQRTLAR